MEEETYFITEVASETEEKPLISNSNDKVESNGKSADLLFIKNRNSRKSRIVSIAEKRLLAKLVEKEPALWDKNNELHFHGPALLAAWRKVSKQMPGREVAECKIIWKSLKDAVRNRKNKIARASDGADESRVRKNDNDMDWELGDCLTYLMDEPSSISRLHQRSFPMEFENSQTSEMRIISVDSANKTPSIDKRTTANCNDDTSASESGSICTAEDKQQEADPLFVESMVNMANSFKELTKEVTQKQGCCEKSPLKFDYIWRNLDVFFHKLPPEDVDELNFKFIQMAYERVKKARDS
ncbi:uncharacterized protein LOC119081541 [Bradysia coprophila]|uniref:uncharacterized protein LOC119081541 n=1 Tax=Bradysia coprophila TaxID=38358 RepID=UPI00187DB497|nr:uncharacterized protein LOC119081541 [Bradysia coprophila]